MLNVWIFHNLLHVLSLIIETNEGISSERTVLLYICTSTCNALFCKYKIYMNLAVLLEGILMIFLSECQIIANIST